MNMLAYSKRMTYPRNAHIEREAKGKRMSLQLLPSRQAQIFKLAKERGRVLVEELATYFAVTPQTIRKDLNELCDRRLLTRTHGGALFPTGSANLEYDERRAIAAEEKKAIGAAAARLIPDRASLFINIGTTTEAVANALLDHDGLMVITNNINVANHLRIYPSFEVIIAGGAVRASDGGIVGEAAVDFIEQFKVDFAVIGVSAIDADGSLLDFDFREVKVAQAILKNARRAILVADSSKFDRTAPVRIAHLSMVDIFITDRCLYPSIRDLCAESGVDLIETAGPEEAARSAD